ncbi:MAG: helix-turn-helix domain-containing protein [Rhodothermaceae bacterium]
MGPLLYFYVKSVTIKNFKLKRIDYLHFIPFAVHFLYLLLVFHLHGAEYKKEMIINRLVFPGVSNVIVYIVIELFIGIYTIYSLKLNFDFSKKLKDNFSSAERTNLNWLWFILLGFTAKWSSDFVYFIFALFKIGGTEIILSFSKIVLFVFVNYMIYRGFKQPEIFEGLEPESTGKNSLSENVLDSYKLKLRSFMSEQKLFLDPELSLKALSEISEIPQRSLSEVIKIGFGQNFYDFINSYRIEEAKKLLTEPTEDSKSVLEILYEAGFKSKSSFHKAFSKHTGLTPTQFRNSKKAI